MDLKSLVSIISSATLLLLQLSQNTLASFFSAVIASNIRISCQIIKYYYFYTIYVRSAFYPVLK